MTLRPPAGITRPARDALNQYNPMVTDLSGTRVKECKLFHPFTTLSSSSFTLLDQSHSPVHCLNLRIQFATRLRQFVHLFTQLSSVDRWHELDFITRPT